MVDEVIKNNISDLHLGANEAPYIRSKTGDIVPVETYGPMTEEEILSIAEIML